MAVRTEWVEAAERFDELAEHWDDFAGASAPPFLRHGWFQAWWRAFGGERSMRACVLWDGDRIVAYLPCYAVRGRLEGMVNNHTPLFAGVADGAENLSGLAQSLLSGSQRVFNARYVAADGDFLRAIEKGAAEAGGRVVSRHQAESPIVETTGTFESYKQSTSSKWLSRLAAYRRQMARGHGLELMVAERPDHFETTLEEGLQLENSGWKAREGTAILSDPTTESFYRDVVELLQRSGELRLSMLRLNGAPAAFDLGFEHGNRLYCLKIGFNESFRKLSPGLVLRLSLVEHCFERGLEAHELLGVNEPWKQRFATEMRESKAIRCYGPRLDGRLASIGGSVVHGRAVPLMKRARARARSRQGNQARSP